MLNAAFRSEPTKDHRVVDVALREQAEHEQPRVMNLLSPPGNN